MSGEVEDYVGASSGVGAGSGRTDSAVGPPPVVNVNIQAPQIVIHPSQGPGSLARAVWIVFPGWGLTAIMIVIACVFAVSIPRLPFAFYLLSRIPAFPTLRSRSKTYQVEATADWTRYPTAVNIEQRPMRMLAVRVRPCAASER